MTISARVIADSISAYNNKRITTFELEYPRFIHSEFMTHRLLSRNAASSRAIPVEKAIQLIIDNMAMPSHWGKNQPGMSAKKEWDKKIVLHGGSLSAPDSEYTREEWWREAGMDAVSYAQMFMEAGYHKQIVNRLLEPFSHIKVVCTATEYQNFYWLRDHPDAQPEIRELAERMREAHEASAPMILDSSEWHVPYFKDGYWTPAHAESNPDDTLDNALKISSSQCAQVSFRKADDTLEKAQDIWVRLVESEPVHASPFEHQATPMPEFGIRIWSDGVTHMDRNGNYWSGNLMGWIQHRQLIPNNVKM